MRILYLSDGYGQHNRGTKHSIFYDVQRRGHTVVFQKIHSAGRNRVNGQRLLQVISKGKFDWVWVAHSWANFVGITLDDIHQVGARVLGFGFSDPYAWNPDKLLQYDAYLTNHFGTLETLRGGRIPVGPIITAGDAEYHTDLGLSRDIDILIFGLGMHPRFDPPSYRVGVVHRLRKRFPDLNIVVYGTKWKSVHSEGYLRGDDFLSVINRTRLSLDLQQAHAPLAHRMFECMMCGTPTITLRRSETNQVFGDWDGIGYYDDEPSLHEEINRVLGLDETEFKALSTRIRQYTLDSHDIRNRMDEMMAWFGVLVQGP